MWHQSGADVLGAQLRPSSLPAASCDRRPAYPLIRCSLPETLVFPGVPLDRSSSTFTPGSPSLPPSLTPGPGKPQVFPPLPPPLTPLEAGVAARLPWHQCTALSRGVQPSSGPEPWDRKWCWQMGEGCESHLSPRRALSSLRWTRGCKNPGAGSSGAVVDSVSRGLWPWEPQLSGAGGSGICGVPCRCVCRDANWEILGAGEAVLGLFKHRAERLSFSTNSAPAVGM